MSGLIVGATEVEPGATLILTGETQGKVHVQDGGRAVIVGRVEGALEADPAAEVRVTGEVLGPVRKVTGPGPAAG